MKVVVKGQGPVDLGKNDFVAQGGQGAVYARGNVAYKVYHKPSGMIPVGKIDELARITDPAVIRPDRLLLDPKTNQPIGYTMAYVQDTWPLVQSFTTAFRKREGLTDVKIADLVKKMRLTVENVHGARCLIVDLNEWNFLLAKAFDRLYFLDADSYKTPSYPANALMESVKDWSVVQPDGRYHASELSDWFSFAVVSFEMFLGLHPYRGKYEGPEADLRGRVASDDPQDSFAVVRRRMQKNISVFNKQVGLPPSTPPFTVIPANWRAWYEAVFERGERCPPPPDLVTFAVTWMVNKTVAGTALTIEEVRVFGGPVTDAYGDDHLVVLTGGGIYSDGHMLGGVPTNGRGVVTTPQTGRVIVGRTGPLAQLWNATDQTDIPLGLNVDDLMAYDGRLYIRSRDRVLEVLLHEMGNKVIASTRLAANVLEQATRMFEGCLVQDMLGSTFVSMFPTPGATYQTHVKELDSRKIVSARFDKNVLMVVAGNKSGQYDRFVFRFDENFMAYDTRLVADVTPNEPNFVALDTGLCVCLDENDDVEMFSTRMGSTTMNTVKDKAMSSDMRLFKYRGKVAFWQGSRVCRLSKK